MIKNTENTYGFVAICLHWVMALAILFMFGLGLYMVELSYYDAWYRSSLDLHKSLGVLLFLVLVLRIIWRTINVEPKPLSKDGGSARFEVIAAKFAHRALYLLMLLLMLSGYLISTADGRGIEVFNIVEVPGLGEFVENQEDVAGEAHEYIAWILISLVLVHVMAALKHHFIDRDGTLKRMIKVVKP